MFINGCRFVEYAWFIWQGKNCRQFRLLTWNFLIDQFIKPIGGDGMKIKVDGRWIYPAAGFTLLENMKICCEIQLIIYPFVFWIKLNVEIIEEPLTEQEIKKEAKEKSKKQSSEVIFKKHFELSMHPCILNHRWVNYERFFSILAIFMTIFGRF